MKTVIEMARDACDKDKVDAWHNGFWTLTQEELERFAERVRADEREQIIDLVAMYGGPVDLEAAIRARSST